MKTKAEKRALLIGILIAAVAVLLFRLTGRVVSAAAAYLLAFTAGSGDSVEALFYEHYQLILLVHRIVALAALAILAVILGEPRETLGLRRIRPRSIPVVLLAGITLSLAVSAALSLIPMSEETVEAYNETMDTLTGGQPLLMGLNLVILTPLVEELTFRAIAFRALRRGLPFWAASLVSSLVFAVLHSAVPQMIYALLLGILFSAIDEKADSALPGFFCHAGFNLLSFVFTLVPPDLPDWTIPVIGAVSAAVTAALLVWLLGGKRPLLSPSQTVSSEVKNDASL